MIAFFRKLSRALRIVELQPRIVVDYSGWVTPKPKVNVSLHSRTGLHSLFTWPMDYAGEAHANLTSGALANLTGFPVDDRRQQTRSDYWRTFPAPPEPGA